MVLTRVIILSLQCLSTLSLTDADRGAPNLKTSLLSDPSYTQMAANLDNWRKWLNSWNRELTALQSSPKGDSEDVEDEDEDDEEEEERKPKKLLKLLKKSCELIRRAEGCNHPDLKEMVDAVAEFQALGVAAAYEGNWFDFLPSYAHSNASPLVNDVNNRAFGE